MVKWSKYEAYCSLSSHVQLNLMKTRIKTIFLEIWKILMSSFCLVIRMTLNIPVLLFNTYMRKFLSSIFFPITLCIVAKKNFDATKLLPAVRYWLLTTHIIYYPFRCFIPIIVVGFVDTPQFFFGFGSNATLVIYFGDGLSNI